MIKIILDSGKEYIINLIESPIKNKIVKSLKHLQHLKLPSSKFDNTIFYNFEIAIEQLQHYASILGITVEVDKIKTQPYLNFLHKIYEENHSYYNSNWLSYHETLHAIEKLLDKSYIPKNITFDYKNLAGYTNTKYTFNELQTIRFNNQPGECFVIFNELGKTPYHYWKNKEPDDFERLCQLAKPMLRFNFAIKLWFEENNLSNLEGLDEFSNWFSKYKNDWCNYWNIPDWSIEQMLGGIPIGYCKDWDKILVEVSNGSRPLYLKLL